MNKEKVQEYLKAIGGQITASTDKWVTCRCVMAKWKHQGGVDNHPSSGMTIKEGGESIYNCYTCKTKGSAYVIYKQLKQMGGNSHLNFKRAMDIINMEEDNDLLLTMPDYEMEIDKKPNEIFDFDELWYSQFPTAYTHVYTQYREVSESMATDLDLRFDTKHHRLLFPIRDWEDVLVGIHGRSMFDDVEPRYYSYPNQDGKRNPDVWMGENHVDLDEPVILVEGQFDYAKIRTHYDNVLSAQTTSIQEAKLKRISVASELITMFDKGTGGDNGRKIVEEYFKGIPVQHLLPPEPWGDLGETPDDEVGELLMSIS